VHFSTDQRTDDVSLYGTPKEELAPLNVTTARYGSNQCPAEPYYFETALALGREKDASRGLTRYIFRTKFQKPINFYASTAPVMKMMRL
jgi:hypothetical protein